MKEDIDWDIYKPSETTYAIGTASSAATSITCSTAAQAVFFKDDACIYITDGTSSEINWVNGDAATATGIITLKNALANAYTGTSCTVQRRRVLRFNYDTPGTSDVVRVVYSGLHTFTDATDTLPAVDLDAVINLASSITAYKVSSKYAKLGESSISADSIDYIDKSREWARVAENYLKMYTDHLGMKNGNNIAASVTQDQDTFLTGGDDFLFHGRRLR